MKINSARSVLFAMALSASTAMFGLPAQAMADGRAVLQVVDADHKAGLFSGVVVVLKSGKPIVSRGWGLADRATGRKWSDTTLTRYASVTKQMIALLVLQEVQAGRMDLDAPLARYVKDAPVWAETVTIEHLLRHTSGLREKDVGDTSTFPYRPASSAAEVIRPRNQANTICRDAPVTTPGTKFSYGDCEYFWLGAVLEEVAGKPWDQLALDRIARPLGLSSWAAAKPGRDKTARGYVEGDTLEPALAVWAFSSAAGMTGTMKDVARFERALIRSELLDPKWTKEMLAGRPEYQSHAMGSWGYEAALDGENLRFVERQGWVGGIRLSLVSVPDEDLVVAMVSNDPDTRFDGAWNPEGFVSRVIKASRLP